MSNLRIAGITAKNLFCFNEISQSFGDENNLLVLGTNYKPGFNSNGSGKTSLINIISYVLKGQVPNSLMQDEVIKIDKDYAYGEIDLIDPVTKEMFKFTRERKRGKSSVLNFTQAKIDSVLGISQYVDFLNLVYITDAGIDSLFSNKNMKNSDRIEFISRLYDLQPLDEAYIHTHNLEFNVAKAMNVRIAKVNQLKQYISDIKDRYTDMGLRDSKQTALQNIKDGERIIEDLKKDINILGETIDPELFGQAKILESRIEENEDFVIDSDEAIAELNISVKEYDKEQVRIECEQLAKKINSNRDETISGRQKLATIKNQINKVKSKCPECDVELLINGTILEKFSAEKAAKLVTKLEKKEKELDLDKIKFKKIQKKLGGIIAVWVSIKEKKEELEKTYTVIETTTKQLDVINLKLKGKNKVDAIKKELLEAELVIDKRELDSLNEQLAQISNDESNLAKYKKDLLKLQEDLKKEEKYTTDLSFWKVGFKEIKRRIIEGFLPEFEHYCNNFLKDFNAGFLIELSTMKEKASGKGMKEQFNFSIFDNLNGLSRDIKTASLGEEKRILLSNFFALKQIAAKRNTNNCGFILVDEILNNLDISGINKFFDVINADSYQKFVVSNDENLADSFDRVINIINESGNIRIE